MDDAEPFVTERLRFARDALAGEASPPEGVGTIGGVRETTAEIGDGIDPPADPHSCPHCGLSLPETGPPACPGCGAPRGPR